ncbi:MAG TPA: hypothetical protein PK514_01090 [Spirochaetota bacterium]|nr:hypothetical protein [Spirochaetota bacterium]
MKYIKDCPSCGRKIRFPLDKGRIKIFCTCGYNTVIDPDDTTLYKTGNFDLKPENKKSGPAENFSKSITNLLNKFTWNNFVNILLKVKYKLQNIRYLPDRERNRIVAVMLFVILAVAATVYFL